MTTNSSHILEDLGDGLILRRAIPADAEALAAFNAEMHGDDEEDAARIKYWIMDLFKGTHPTIKAEDFTVVEDTTQKMIVSSLNLIDQTWTYEGIPFGVGRPELVGTHPDYRQRGLVRKQFEVVHGWSAERGHKLQAVTGIPWFYRQFGYEMTINLGGSRRGYIQGITELEEGEEEAFIIRPALEQDISFITELYNKNMQRSPITCYRDETIWRYELLVRDPKSEPAKSIHIMENSAGERIGYLLLRPILFGTTMVVSGFELISGVSWFDTSLAMLRHIKKVGEGYAERDSTKDTKKEMKHFSLDLGEDHPVYQVLSDRTIPRMQKPYSYYIRVPDIPDFLRLIAPALEDRLACSYLPGYSGELKLDLYTSGIVVSFEKGKIKAVEPWALNRRENPERMDASARFPDLTFLQLLFGHRSLDELDHAFTDVLTSWRQEESVALLKALFPRRPSFVFSLE